MHGDDGAFAADDADEALSRAQKLELTNRQLRARVRELRQMLDDTRATDDAAHLSAEFDAVPVRRRQNGGAAVATPAAARSRWQWWFRNCCCGLPLLAWRAGRFVFWLVQFILFMLLLVVGASMFVRLLQEGGSWWRGTGGHHVPPP